MTMNPRYSGQYPGGFSTNMTPAYVGSPPDSVPPSGPAIPGSNVYNGPSRGPRPQAPPPQVPMGPPYMGGAPVKQGMPLQPPRGQFGMSGPTQNGPQSGGYPRSSGDNLSGLPRMSSVGPPHGNQPMGLPPTSMQSGGPVPGMLPSAAAAHSIGQLNQMRPAPPPPPPTSATQIANQMGALSLSGQHSGLAQSNVLAPPPTSGGPSFVMSGPPPSSTGPHLGMSGPPPSSTGPHLGMSGPPPTGTGLHLGMSGPPPTGTGPHLGMSGPPPTGTGPHLGMSGPPTGTGPHSGMSGPPPTNFSGHSGGPPVTGYAQTPEPGMPFSSVPRFDQSAGTHSVSGQVMQPGMSGLPSLPSSQPGVMNQGPPTSIGAVPPQSLPSSHAMSPVSSSAGQFPPQPGQYTGNTLPGSSQYRSAPGMHPGGMQPQQPRKLDPDQMPSPIQVIEDDRRSKSGVFSTNQSGTVPPLITTNFLTQDQGNCNPRFIRSTMYNVPCTSDMLKNSHIPFALTITPFAKLHPKEHMPPLVDLGELGPVRCKRCKAYMNPAMQYIDGGRSFQCVFCNCSTDVPQEYFAHLDHTGRRIDWYDRPELCLGSFEFVATKDYCKDGIPPKPPAFIFMIDVSYNSVRNGLVHLVCSRLKEDILVNLPKEAGAEESEIRVGFVTYTKDLHFYNVKGSLAQPQMLVVTDLEDMFVPLLDGFLVKLSESETVIDSLLAQIPQMFAESRETELVLGPVIQAGLDALKSTGCAGKLFIFHTSLPIADAPGKLKNRDDRKLLGTEKEKTLLMPLNSFYTKLGQECVTAGCSVDFFLFPNAYVDLASMSEVCRLTGGSVYKYSYFQADLDGERFMDDLKRNITRPLAFDAILRVRTSTGIRPVDFYGNFYMSNTTDVELAAIDCDQSISVEIKHDDKLSEGDGAYIQVATLYTSVSGQRRLRIHNLALNCCTQFADLFRSCELDTLVNFLSKQTIRYTLNGSPKLVRENLANQVAQILACYRKNCASPSSAGQLILPECMKLLPLYGNCISKSDAIQGGSEISTDDKSYLILLVNAMGVSSSNVFFYPRLIPLHHLDAEKDDMSDADSYLPTAIRCSLDRLEDNGIYLLENGVNMYLWLGHNVNPEWVQKVFGVQSAAQIDIDKCKLMNLDNLLSQKVRNVVRKIRLQRNRHMKLTIVRQRDKLEPWFNHFLVEDKGLNGAPSYVDFLCHVHKEIRNLLS